MCSVVFFLMSYNQPYLNQNNNKTYIKNTKINVGSDYSKKNRFCFGLKKFQTSKMVVKQMLFTNIMYNKKVVWGNFRLHDKSSQSNLNFLWWRITGFLTDWRFKLGPMAKTGLSFSLVKIQHLHRAEPYHCMVFTYIQWYIRRLYVPMCTEIVNRSVFKNCSARLWSKTTEIWEWFHSWASYREWNEVSHIFWLHVPLHRFFYVLLLNISMFGDYV